MKSLYTKITVVFLGLWWALNLAILAVMFSVVTMERVQMFFPIIKALGGEFYNFKLYTILAFAASILIGTTVIILVVRGIVKPIRTISSAAREVAEGDFDVEVHVKSRDELGVLTADFNQMVRELRSTEAMRERFVHSVSHEFRTPVTSIKGYAEFFREDAEGKRMLENGQKLQYSNIIIAESERLITLSSDLLRLSEVESRAIPEEEFFYLDEQLRKVVVLLEPLWSSKDIEFALDMEEIEYIGPKDLLHQVWVNLLQNAIKFSHHGGIIAISAREDEDCYRVSITDQGIGMPPEVAAHIFEAFYKANASGDGEGNGLGLAIVHRIITMIGGTIAVQTAENEGAAFNISLPRYRL